jgi:protein SDA1
MAYMHKKVLLTLKLPQLQNFIKRDSEAYKDEFIMQQRHFESELEIFKLRPTQDSDRFTELVTFMCHVAACYKEETKDLAPNLIQLLEESVFTLHPDVRAKFFQSHVLLHIKLVFEPIILLRESFKLFSVPDKALRVSLGEYIINDIKAINQNKHNDKLNRSIQAMLYNIVITENAISARKTVEILADLYRKRVWTDARTVNVIGSACTSPVTRVFISAINFFLGIENKMFEDEEDEKSGARKEVDYHDHSKKTKKRLRVVKKQIETNAKNKRDLENKEVTPLFPAIQLLHDPQDLAEKLFKKLRQTGERFEVKLLLMNFISRLIGCHKLTLLSFYSFVQKYLTSHQQNVTKILAYLIQGCHDMVPPEELAPVVRAIAYNFITEICSTEVVAVGINSVREIIVRVPALLREPGMSEFVQDLIQYSKKAHKSVMIAAHSVLNLFRCGIVIVIAIVFLLIWLYNN